MTKLIVEMEMPQACPCDLIGIGYAMCCSAANSRKRIAEYDECVKNGTKPDWCPIKGVLPDEHGDLIDRDALLEKYNVKDTNIAECLTDKKMARAFERFCIIADALEAAPTVIAAERKDDERTDKA